MSAFVKIRSLYVLLLLTVILQACNLPKLARKEGAFLYENDIKVSGTRDAILLGSDLTDYIKQKPNKKLIGLTRVGLRSYKLGSRFPQSKIGRFFQINIGEAPVVLDSSLIEASVTGMKNYLKTQGYYYPEITYKTSGRIHKKKVSYLVKPNTPYKIRTVSLHIADKVLDSIARQNMDDSHVKYTFKVSLEQFLKEKTRLAELYRNQGYYDFNKDLVNFDIDTNIGNFQADVGINIANPIDFHRFKPYTIKSVGVRVEPNVIDTLTWSKDSLSFGDFYYFLNTYKLNPAVLQNSILVKPGTIFKENLANASFGKLNELRIFRAVNLNAIPSNSGTDSASIDYFIRLQPTNKYDFIIEPQAITSDQSNLVSNSTGRNYGIASQITLANNNIFGNAEILQLTYRLSVEAQRGEGIPKRPLFNSFESNLSASLIFPKLLLLDRLDKKNSNSTNRSILTASTIWERNIDWIRNVYGLSFIYQISRKQFSYYFVPTEISYIKTAFNSDELAEQSKNDPYLQSVFSNNFVTSFRGGFIFNNQNDPKRKNFTFIKWDVLELAGSLLDLGNKALNVSPNDSGFRTFFGVRYFQYAKTFADLRYNHFLDVNNRVAGRLAIGVAVPFGNSPDFIPFDKRFFTGGANSIRAFLPRSIGPGTYTDEGGLDRSGDVKLEVSLEYRFNIYDHFIEGAVFTDAGNIWRIIDDGREGAVFTFDNFYKQLAVGGGVGMRLNLDFLILRLDAAIPIFDPRRPEKERYVFDEYGNLGELWNQTIFNIGVGYPF